MSRKGPRPLMYAVHGELMTVQQVAQMAGVTPTAVRFYRLSHPNPDGTPCSYEQALDAYLEARAAGKKRTGDRFGPKPYTFTCKGVEMSIRQAAEMLGVSYTTVYKSVVKHQDDLEAAIRDIEAREEKRAARRIVEIIEEGGGSACAESP